MGVAERGTTGASVSVGAASEAIGRRIDEVQTPALVLDLPAAMENVTRMESELASLSASLRPHIKVHKCAELACLQLEHGAIGVTTATVAEAEAMANAGVGEILVANEVVGGMALDRVVRVATSARVTIAIDDEGPLADLAERAVRAGATLGVVVELDVGMGRGGARSVEEALELGREAAQLDGVELRGLLGYEGHVASEPDPAARDRGALASMEILIAAAERFAAEGLSTEIVSAGATGTYRTTGAVPGVTEVQAGSYVLMDRFHASLAPEFRPAVSIAATAISVHGGLAVFDAGRKALGGDFGPPVPPDPEGGFAFLHEEHVGFDYPGPAPYRVGDRVALEPTYAPTTVNLFGAFHVVEDGTVIDAWPVLARHA